MHDQLQHAGNLGADGQGNTVVANLGQSTQGGMYGYYKSVDDRQNRDPTVRPFPVFVLFANETETFLLEFHRGSHHSLRLFSRACLLYINTAGQVLLAWAMVPYVRVSIAHSHFM